jgi:hypothetical protein
MTTRVFVLIECCLIGAFAITLMEALDVSIKLIPVLVALVVGWYARSAHKTTAEKNRKELELLDQKIEEQRIRNLNLTKNESRD